MRLGKSLELEYWNTGTVWKHHWNTGITGTAGTTLRVEVVLNNVTRLKFSNTVPSIGKHLIVKTLQTINPDKVESVNSHLEVRQKRIESRLNNSIEIDVDVDVDLYNKSRSSISSSLNNGIESYWFEALYVVTFNDTNDESDLDDDPEELKILLKHRVHPAANKKPNGN
ncbi:2705_t:CDS:2 [Entrophospora sp. SA101]|nr:2705_t:CDS:2 [Entrophospora sp. SA101]